MRSCSGAVTCRAELPSLSCSWAGAPGRPHRAALHPAVLCCVWPVLGSQENSYCFIRGFATGLCPPARCGVKEKAGRHRFGEIKAGTRGPAGGAGRSSLADAH